MIRRLRVKFICINMAVATVMLLAILGMLLHFTHDNLEQQSIRVMQSVMEDRAYPSRPGKFPRQAQLPYFYVSVNTLGELSASFGGYYDLTDTAAIQQIITLALNSDDQTGILKDYSLRFQKRTTPFGQTIVFVDMSSELATMRSLTNTCIGIGVLGFAVFLGLSFLLARWAVKPVETAWNQQRQFVADASHELKTPLTVILTNAELLQEPEYDEQARSRFVDSIMTMSHQMRGLVESLLELARADNGGQNLVFSRLNFSELVGDALLPFEPVYFEKGLTLESNVEENLFVKGSQQHLKQVADILLDNAAKHGGSGKRIDVSIAQDGEEAVIRIRDYGPGIPEEELPHVKYKFYKGSSKARGSGIGLAVCEEIVTRHEGTLTIGNAEGGGCLVTIRLPIEA